MKGIRRPICYLIPVSILFLTFSISCIERVERPARIDYSRYIPLHEGDWWLYSGHLGKLEVIGSVGNLYTVALHDSLGNSIGWADYTKNETGIYLNNIIFSGQNMPSVFFQPALRFSPWTRLVGDTLFQTTAEIWMDSANTHKSVSVEYEVLSIDTMVTLAGEFENCIRLRINYNSSEESRERLYGGESIWWFAQDIGIIKYKAFGETGELIKGQIDGVSYP